MSNSISPLILIIKSLIHQLDSLLKTKHFLWVPRNVSISSNEMANYFIASTKTFNNHYSPLKFHIQTLFLDYLKARPGFINGLHYFVASPFGIALFLHVFLISLGFMVQILLDTLLFNFFVFVLVIIFSRFIRFVYLLTKQAPLILYAAMLAIVT